MAELLYEGKAKQVYKTEKEDEYLIHYKDDATAGNVLNMISLKVKVF